MSLKFLMLLLTPLWLVAQEEASWTLVWNDEFAEDGLPDSTKWSYDVGDACDLPAGCGWGNKELQYYTGHRLKNARIQNGHLYIEAHPEKYHNSSYTSARLHTRGHAAWQYGKIVVRAKLPKGLGVWPAIWMLPLENNYGGWPRSGEIDIMENVGYDPDTIVASAHTQAYNHSIGTHKNAKMNVPDNGSTFHDYILEWDASLYKVYVDDQLLFTYKNDGTGSASWPFDQPFYLILNVAVGGNWGGLKGVNMEDFPSSMIVDYIRIYAAKD